MSILTRLLAALSITSIGIATCFAVASGSSVNVQLLCQKVDIELRESVRQEILTEEEVIAISQRCHARYSNS